MLGHEAGEPLLVEAMLLLHRHRADIVRTSSRHLKPRLNDCSLWPRVCSPGPANTIKASGVRVSELFSLYPLTTCLILLATGVRSACWAACWASAAASSQYLCCSRSSVHWCRGRDRASVPVPRRPAFGPRHRGRAVVCCSVPAPRFATHSHASSAREAPLGRRDRRGRSLQRDHRLPCFAWRALSLRSLSRPSRRAGRLACRSCYCDSRSRFACAPLRSAF